MTGVDVRQVLAKRIDDFRGHAGDRTAEID